MFLDLEFITMVLWTIGLGALGAAAAGIMVANTDWFLSKPEKATLEYLQNAELKCIEGEMDPQPFKAGELWQKTGAVIMAVRRPGWFLCREEASELSSVKPQLDRLGVPLYAVVKENIGTEVIDFKKYFKGEVYLDDKRCFYGPFMRKMAFSGFVRLSVLKNFQRAWKNGFTGNLDGEGFILGGVFVIGSEKQGILLEHREMEAGDKVNVTAILEAAGKIQQPGTPKL